MGHDCLDGAFSLLRAFPDVLSATENVPGQHYPAAIVLVSNAQIRIGIVVMCSATFERYSRSEQAIGDAKRMFGRIDIGLCGQNRCIESYGGRKGFVPRARHPAKRSWEPDVDRFQPHNLSILGAS